MYTLYTLFINILFTILRLIIDPPKKAFHSQYISDQLIIFQCLHILFHTNLPYFVSLIFPSLSVLLLKTLVDTTNELTAQQKQCIITCIHEFLIIILGLYTLMVDYVPNIAYYIIGFSDFYLLYDSICSYTSDNNKFLDNKLIMVIHHLLIMILIENIIDFNECGRMILIAYAFMKISNIPHWYSYFLTQGQLKKNLSPYLIILDSFMFIIIKSLIMYYVLLNSYAKLDIYIIGTILLLGSWKQGYDLLISLFVVD